MLGNGKIPVIALTITIIAMLVLAAVAIRGVTADGLIDDVGDTTGQYVQAQEESSLNLKVTQWRLNARGTTTLESYLKKEYGEDNVRTNTDKSIIVITKNDNRYKVTEAGEVTLVKQFSY